MGVTRIYCAFQFYLAEQRVFKEINMCCVILMGAVLLIVWTKTLKCWVFEPLPHPLNPKLSSVVSSVVASHKTCVAN